MDAEFSDGARPKSGELFFLDKEVNGFGERGWGKCRFLMGDIEIDGFEEGDVLWEQGDCFSGFTGFKGIEGFILIFDFDDCDIYPGSRLGFCREDAPIAFVLEIDFSEKFAGAAFAAFRRDKPDDAAVVVFGLDGPSSAPAGAGAMEGWLMR